MDTDLPKLAVCNFQGEAEDLKRFAVKNGFAGVDWTFKTRDLPENECQESRLCKEIARLHPLEVRYHCAFKGIDVGDADVEKARDAVEIFAKVCRLVSKMEGRYVTIHLGLGRTAMHGLSWDRTIGALTDLVGFADGLGVCVCLENLASGWSSRPELFEKLIRKSGAGITLDIGHARVSPSIESQYYVFEDFVAPHESRVFNAHVYHEEREGRHLPPTVLSDMFDRLVLLDSLPCDWWVLELREEQPLRATLDVVRQFLYTKEHSCAAPATAAGTGFIARKEACAEGFPFHRIAG